MRNFLHEFESSHWLGNVGLILIKLCFPYNNMCCQDRMITGPAFEHYNKTIYMNKILITLAIGIGLGLLLAPAKGSETWKRLKDGLNDLKEDAADEADDLIASGKKALKQGRKKLESAIN